MKKKYFYRSIMLLLGLFTSNNTNAQDTIPYKKLSLDAGFGIFADVLLALEGDDLLKDDCGKNTWVSLRYQWNRKWSAQLGFMYLEYYRGRRTHYAEFSNAIIDIDFKRYAYQNIYYASLLRTFQRKRHTWNIGMGFNLDRGQYQSIDEVTELRFFPREVPRIIVQESTNNWANAELGVLLNIDYQWMPNQYYHIGAKFQTWYYPFASSWQYLTLSPYFGIRF